MLLARCSTYCCAQGQSTAERPQPSFPQKPAQPPQTDAKAPVESSAQSLASVPTMPKVLGLGGQYSLHTLYAELESTYDWFLCWSSWLKRNVSSVGDQALYHQLLSWTFTKIYLVHRIPPSIIWRWMASSRIRCNNGWSYVTFWSYDVMIWSVFWILWGFHENFQFCCRPDTIHCIGGTNSREHSAPSSRGCSKCSHPPGWDFFHCHSFQLLNHFDLRKQEWLFWRVTGLERGESKPFPTMQAALLWPFLHYMSLNTIALDKDCGVTLIVHPSMTWKLRLLVRCCFLSLTWSTLLFDDLAKIDKGSYKQIQLFEDPPENAKLLRKNTIVSMVRLFCIQIFHHRLLCLAGRLWSHDCIILRRHTLVTSYGQLWWVVIAHHSVTHSTPITRSLNVKYSCVWRSLSDGVRFVCFALLWHLGPQMRKWCIMSLQSHLGYINYDYCCNTDSVAFETFQLLPCLCTLLIFRHIDR